MTRTHSSRGSVLLLVVGLLTMVAMLGATFLIVARMNTRQVKDATVKNQADPVAAGAVATLAEILRQRLYIGDTGPFALAFTRDNVTLNQTTGLPNDTPLYNSDCWKMYIDYPEADIDRFLTVGDPVLPYQAFDVTGVTPYNVNDVVSYNGSYYYCILAESQCTGVDPTLPSPPPVNNYGPPDSAPSHWAPCVTVDTDGDGIPDSWLMPTGVVNSSGERYFVAIKVSDTCGKINLNVATNGQTVNLTNPISPANVDLRVGLCYTTPPVVISANPNFADLLVQFRGPLRGAMNMSGLCPKVMSEFNSICAQRLLNPVDDGYRDVGSGLAGSLTPFGVNEEAYLAYYGPIPQLGLLSWDTGAYPARVPCWQSGGNLYLGGAVTTGNPPPVPAPVAPTALLNHLTVWSSDRDLVRHPDSDLASRAIALVPGTPSGSIPGIVNAPTFANGSLTANDACRQLVYQQALSMLNPLIYDLTTRKYAAASFTANLWYHLDLTLSGEPYGWGFTPSGETFTAFAIPKNTPELPRIYLTEAYFKTDGKGAPTAPPAGKAAGPESVKMVELWAPGVVPNNTADPRNFVAPLAPLAAYPGTTTKSTFFIKFGAGTPIALSTICSGNTISQISANGFITLFFQSGGISMVTGKDGSPTPVQFIAPPAVGTSYDCSSLPSPDFSGPIQLLVQITNTANGYVSPYIPVDQIDPTAPGIPPSFNTTVGAAGVTPIFTTPYSWDMAKDTSDTLNAISDYRYTVAAAVNTNTTTGAGTTANNTCGTTNTGITGGASGIGTKSTTGQPATPNPVAWAPTPVVPPVFQLTGTLWDANVTYNPGCYPGNVVGLSTSPACNAPGCMVLRNGAAYLCGSLSTGKDPSSGLLDGNSRQYWISANPPNNAVPTIPFTPMINTLGELSEIYFCGPITLNPAAITGPFYPFSAMISSGGSLGTSHDATNNPTYFTAAFPITDTVNNLGNYPLRGRLDFKSFYGGPAPIATVWSAGTTYGMGAVVPYPLSTSTTYYISLQSGNKGQRPNAVGSLWWAQSAGWPKNPTGAIMLPPVAGYYPDVPLACLLGEFFDPLQPDPTRTDEWRHYGRINVNTATSDVLSALPWPSAIIPYNGNPPAITPANLQQAAVAFILAYRDQQSVVTTTGYTANYTVRATGTSGIRNLRLNSNFNGFLTPGEVAIPLADLCQQIYVNSGVCTLPTFLAAPNYALLRDQLYRQVSNLLTVRSDTFRANVYVELRDSTGTRTRQAWRYLTIIDRSNCRKASDRPAIMLFTEIR
jgi:hypothetical protein